MDKPKSIERSDVDGRPCTVVTWPDGLMKIITDDGEVIFARATEEPPGEGEPTKDEAPPG